MTILKYLSFLLLLVCSKEIAASTDIPIDHPVYADIPLFLSKPMALEFDPWLRPCSKENILTLLKMVVADNESDWKELAQYYICEFDPANCPNSTSGKAKLASFNFSKGTDSFSVYPQINIIAAIQDSNFNRHGIVNVANGGDTGKIMLDSMGPNKEFKTVIHTGLSAEGNLGNLSLFFKGGINTYYASRDKWAKTNDPKRGIMLSNIFEKQDVRGHLWGDEDFVGYINLPSKIADFKLGRDVVKWGQSDNHSLAMSGNAAPFIQLRTTRNIGPLDFQFVMGRITADSHDDIRYLYAKHITWRPTPKLTLGFNDQVITINRTLEPYYFIPVLPFYFAEHFTGDLDNRLMGIDAAYQTKYFTIYSEFFMDDMRNLAGVFNDSDVSNKWAVLAGLRLNKSPWPKLLATATLEFSQVEPWVYTSSARPHYDTIWTIEDSTGYAKFNTREIFNYPVHYGRLLGNPLGPNSRSLLFKATSRPKPEARVDFGVEMVWKGSGPGSAITDMNPAIVDTTAESGLNYRFQDKQSIRFSNLALQRTIVSAEASYYYRLWNETAFKMVFVRENALNPGNYFQISLSNSINF